MLAERLRKRKALRRYRQFDTPAESVSANAGVRDGRLVVSFGDRSFFVDPGKIALEERATWDFALFGLAAISMSHNIAIRFESPVTESAAAVVERLRRDFETWNIVKLAPLRLEVPNTEADNAHESRKGGIICLSGGIDSTAAAIEAKEVHGFGGALLIAGADYPSVEDPGFIELSGRVAGLAERLGLELRIAATSIRRIGFEWESLFSLNLAMCLHAQSAQFRAGAIGADMTLAQDLVSFPWGGNHALHSCFATADFAVLSLNARDGRTEKLRKIMAYDAGLIEHLSVCWSDTSTGGNCGRCPKCQRTKLNFLAAVGDIPDIFSGEASLNDYVRALKVPERFSRVRVELVMFADIHRDLPEGETKDLVGKHLERLKLRHAQGMPLP